MIPDYEGNGLLPVGIHLCELKEFEARFCYTIWRMNLYKHLLVLIADLKKIGCVGIYVDGSFITNKRLPNDIDVCWNDTGLDYGMVRHYMPILFDLKFPRTAQKTMYMADIFPAHLIEGLTGKHFIDFFQIDKTTGLAKGIIEIKIP